MIEKKSPPLVERVVRIIVVDDHPLMRKGLVDLFNEHQGFAVCGDTESGAGALELAARERPDVAVVDLSLGAENGLDLVASLTKLHPEVRILVLSGLDERLHADRSLSAGALGYIMKDQPADEVIAAVARVAAGKSYVSAETADRILSSLGSANRKDGASSFDRLSNRERHVLTLIGRGLSTREIAVHLKLSVKTVEAHYGHIKEKLGLRNGRELMRVAVSWSEGTRS